MGVVYKARQNKLRRTVALKMILGGGHASGADLERFRTEGEAIARLQHPHIVQIYEVGEHNGLPYFSLEFCGGGSLEKKLAGTPLPPREAAALVEKLAQAMQAAHDQHVIHRDLKPANVLLAEDGTPKITDFGLAKKLDEVGKTQTGSIMGTPSYMAPEQAGGKSKDLGPACDIYALGAVLYDCLTGRPPFRAATPLDTVMQVVSEEPVPPTQLNAKLPRDLETICLKCLQKEAAKRYSSAANLAQDLRRFLAGEPIEARPVSAAERAAKWVKRRPLVAALAAVILLLLVAGTAISTGFAIEAADRADDAERNAYHADQSARDAFSKAELARAKEKEARDERDNAQRQREEVRKANEHLQTAQKELRHALYAAQLNLVQVAWDADNIARVRDLLEQLRPGPRQTDLRSFEWNYWDRLSHRELWTRELGSWDFSRMTFSPDGMRLAAIFRPLSLEKEAATKLRVWETRPNKEYLTLEEVTGSIEHVSFSADSKRLMAAVNGQAKMWDAVTGKLLLTVGSPGSVSQVMASTDGKRLVGVMKIMQDGKAASAVKVWDAGSGEELASQQLPGGTEAKVAFSADVERFVVATPPDKSKEQIEIYVRDTGSGKQLAAWLLPVGEMIIFEHQPVFSPDGKRLAAPLMKFEADLFKAKEKVDPDFPERLMSSVKIAVRVWEAGTGKELLTLQGMPTAKLGLAFSPDGSDLAVLDGASGGVKVWDAATGKEKFTEPGRAGTAGTGGSQGLMPYVSLLDLGLVYSGDGKLLIASGFGSTVRTWDVSKGQWRLNLKGHTGSVAAAAFSPDGKRCYSAGMEGTLKAWDTSPGDDPIRLEAAAGLWLGSPAISPDGKRMAMAKRAAVRGEQKPARGEIAVLDTDTRQALLSINIKYGTWGGLTFSPDGRRLAAVLTIEEAKQFRKELMVWDAATGDALFSVQNETTALGGVGSLVFHPDGERLVALVTEDALKGITAVKMWNTTTGERLLTMRGGSPAWNMVFSPDGTQLVVAAAGKQTTIVTVRDSTTGKEIRTVDVGPCLTGQVAWSSDGKLLAVAAKSTFLADRTEVKVLDAATCKQRYILTVMGLGFLMAFSPDSKRLVTNSGIRVETGQTGNEVKIWDATTGLELSTLKGPIAFASSMDFSADGTKLMLTGSGIRVVDGLLLQVWDTTRAAEKQPGPGVQH
jgi:eukaryotic-like serine/threonine-protein kinase